MEDERRASVEKTICNIIKPFYHFAGDILLDTKQMRRSYVSRYYNSMYGSSQFGGSQTLATPGTSDEYYEDGTQQSIRDTIYEIFMAGYPPPYAAKLAKKAYESLLYTEVNPLEQLNTLPVDSFNVGDFDIRSQYYNFNWRRGAR